MIGVLVPPSNGQEWRFKYLKNGGFTSISEDLCDNIDNAKTFSIDGSDTKRWIEQFFSDADQEGRKDVDERTFTRNNFGVFQHDKPADNGSVVKVATSDRIEVDASNFSLGSLGSGSTRKVFLTYNGSSDE